MNFAGSFPPRLTPHTQILSQRQIGKHDHSVVLSIPSSVASVWSDAASQFSDNSSVTSDPSTIPSSPSILDAKPVNNYESSFPSSYWPRNTTHIQSCGRQMPLPKREDLNRKKARPTKISRQTVRKNRLIYSLVDTSAHIIEAIWPLSFLSSGRSGCKAKLDLPLRKFIEETLYRSGTSYSTLQVALYYLVLIRPHVIRPEFLVEQFEQSQPSCTLQCGRRMFLSALILASKYLQDRNYSARAWSKISGLDVKEINRNEMAFLCAVNWRLHITKTVFQRWVDIVSKYTPTPIPCAVTTSINYHEVSPDLKLIVLGLNSQLDNVNDLVEKLENYVSYSPSQNCHVLTTTSHCNTITNIRTSPSIICHTPKILEPSLSPKLPASRAAPALGLLPYSQIKYKNMYLNHLAVNDSPNCSNKLLSIDPQGLDSVNTMLARLDEQTSAPPIDSFLSHQLNQHIIASPTYPTTSSKSPGLDFSRVALSSFESSIPSLKYMPLSIGSNIHTTNRNDLPHNLESQRSLNIIRSENEDKNLIYSSAQHPQPLINKSIMEFCPDMSAVRVGSAESLSQNQKEHIRYHEGLQIYSNLAGSRHQTPRNFDPSPITYSKQHYYRNSIKLPGLSQLLRKRAFSDFHLSSFRQPTEQNNHGLYTTEYSLSRKRTRCHTRDSKDSQDRNHT